MKRKFRKCARGAISLFLVVLLLPFTEIASSLISAQRYNASIALLDEVMDSSMLSTLSDYDGYLRERFGLFAVSQQKDLSTNFNSYFDYNSSGVLHNALGDNLTVTATGGLSLSDDDVLLMQIDEYNKLNAPFKMVNDVLDLGELIKNFEKKYNITNILNVANAGLDICNGAMDFGESYQQLVMLSNSIYDLIGIYNTAYNEFSTAIADIYQVRDEINQIESEESQLNSELNDLNDQMEELQKALLETEDEEEKKRIQSDIDDLTKEIQEKKDDIKDNQDANEEKSNEIQSLTRKFNTKRDEFAAAHTDLIAKLSQYKSKLITALGQIESMVNSTGELITATGNTISEELKVQAEKSNEDINKKLEAYDKGKEKDDEYYSLVLQKSDNDSTISNYNMTYGMNSGLKNANSEISRLMNEAKEAFDEEAIQNVIDNLTNQKSIVSNLTVDDVKNKQNGGEYYITINVVLSEEQLERLYLYFDDMSNDITISISDIWEAIKSFLESIFKVKLVYDPALCSEIDTAYFLNQFGITIDNPATNPVAALIQAIAELVSGVANVVTGVGFMKKFKGIKDVLLGVVHIVTSLGRVVTQVVSNVKAYINDPSQMLLPYYFVQTLPCRTDYKTGSNMTGGKYSKIEYANYGDSGVNGLPVIESVVSLFNLAFGEKEANDKMFCGAELEYLIAGGSSEIENQATVFGMLYIIRMLCDIPCWKDATELQLLATGPQYAIVLAIYLVLEPFLDCVLLVNGENVPLLKSAPYLSTVGMANYIPKLIKVVGTDDTSSANLKYKLARIFKSAGENGSDDNFSFDTESIINDSYKEGLIKLNYKEYLLLLMLLFSNHDAELSLFKNLIQMETLAYNTKNKKGDFDLRNAYTQITCEVSGSAKPLLAIAFSDSVFKFYRTQCRGY